MPSIEKETPTKDAVVADDPTRDKAMAFFQERLVPAAAALRQRGVRFLSSGTDPSPESWWIPYTIEADEELTSLGPSVERLAALWREHPELAALSEPIFELAQEVRPIQSTKAEVSPFVYVMF